MKIDSYIKWHISSQWSAKVHFLHVENIMTKIDSPSLWIEDNKIVCGTS